MRLGVQPREEKRNTSMEGTAYYKELRLLEEIQRTPEVSQRQLARQLGVALGVANALLRNLASQGHIRATQVGWKRWIYALTPSGSDRKLQLTTEYVEEFLNHYRRVRYILQEDLSEVDLSSNAQVAVEGISEFSELVYLALNDLGQSNVAFMEDDSPEADFLGRPVRNLQSTAPEEYAKVIVAFADNVDSKRQSLSEAGFSSDQIMVVPGKSNGEDGMIEEEGSQNNMEISNNV